MEIPNITIKYDNYRGEFCVSAEFEGGIQGSVEYEGRGDLLSEAFHQLSDDLEERGK